MHSTAILRTLRLLTSPSPPYRTLSNAASVGSSPTFQQKRRVTTDFTCIGWDGAPLTSDPNSEVESQDEKKAREEENREYFKDRKATPLSETVLAETRKPIERMWDGGTAGDDEDLKGEFVEDTADAALRRAELLFKAAKERGDPETPWGRVLAEKRVDV